MPTTTGLAVLQRTTQSLKDYLFFGDRFRGKATHNSAKKRLRSQRLDATPPCVVSGTGALPGLSAQKERDGKRRQSQRLNATPPCVVSGRHLHFPVFLHRRRETEEGKRNEEKAEEEEEIG